MRMLLVQPPQGTRFGLSRILTGEPLGLECVGGAVRSRGYDAELVDLRLDSWEALDRALDDPPAAAGISCAFTTDVYPSLEVARFLKERCPALPVVVGGHHASLVPDDFLRPGSGVDAVAIGEGEWAGVGAMDALKEGQPLETVPGLMTLANKDNGFKPRPFTRELDRLPTADRSLTARYRHRYHHGLVPRSASVETSRGCPFDCNFCSVWVFYERRAGRRSPRSIVEELKRLEEDHVFFTDDIAFLNYDSYRELGERIEAEGLQKTYACETRSDLVVRYRDLFARWSRVGLRTIFLGIERIDDAGLDAVRKRTKGGSSTNVEAIRILREEGIIPMTTFITDPAWAEEDFDRLEEFIDRLRLPNASFSILTPLPGTELYNARRGELVTEDYGYYDILHAVLPTRLPVKRFYERVARLYGNTLRDTRPSWAMVRRAVKLALGGNLWCMRRVFLAVNELRTPSAYLEPPVRVRAPRRGGERRSRESPDVPSPAAPAD
ncbi:MAG: hopanoid C-3 methylase HpnR [Acidobacteria bacterium]|nr:MAG: hopanoid C-3 methylase HpnR [Acidobacteriota bacterium]